jgi:hypothetical protein
VFTFFGVNLGVIRLTKARQALLMTARDSRMKTCTEFLNYIKILKLYCWEERFAENIYTERENEMAKNVSYLKINVIINMLMWGMRYYVSIAMIVTMALWGLHFDPGSTFSGLSLIRSLIV